MEPTAFDATARAAHHHLTTAFECFNSIIAVPALSPALFELFDSWHSREVLTLQLTKLDHHGSPASQQKIQLGESAEQIPLTLREHHLRILAITQVALFSILRDPLEEARIEKSALSSSSHGSTCERGPVYSSTVSTGCHSCDIFDSALGLL